MGFILESENAFLDSLTPIRSTTCAFSYVYGMIGVDWGGGFFIARSH